MRNPQYIHAGYSVRDVMNRVSRGGSRYSDFSGITLSEDNPVVLAGADDNLRNQNIFEIDENTWGMAYLVGGHGSTPGIREGIKYATAPKSDPHNWTKVDTFLIESDTLAWDTNIDGMDIRKLDDGSWLGIYTDWASGKVGIATRAAGSFGPFTKSANNPIIDNSANVGGFDEFLRHCCWIKKDDTYYLFCEARTGDNDGELVTNRGIVLYTTTDLETWTLYGGDYLLHASDFPNTWVAYNNLWMPNVEQIGDNYFMVCLCHRNNYDGRLDGSGFVMFKSTDLINWELLNTQRAILPHEGKAGTWEEYANEEASFFYESGNVHLYYNARSGESTDSDLNIGYGTLTSGAFDNNRAPLFSDDFSDDSIDTSKWDVSEQGGITILETGGKLQISADGSSQALVEVLAGLTGFDAIDNVRWTFAFKYNRDTINGGDCQIGVMNADNSNKVFFSKGTTLNKIVLNVVLGGVSVYSEEVDYNQGRLKIQKSGAQISFWQSSEDGWQNITPSPSSSVYYYNATTWTTNELVYPKVLAANDTNAYIITIDDTVVFDFNSPMVSDYILNDVDPNYEEILNFAAFSGYSTPSSAKQTKENAFMLALKDAGLYNKAIRGKMFKTDGDSDYACIDWVAPRTAAALAEKINNPVFTSDGFNSNGTSSYLLSGCIISDVWENAVTYCARGFVDAAVNSRALFGAGDDTSFGITNGGVFVNPRNGSDGLTYRVSTSGTAASKANSDATVRISIARENNVEYLSVNGGAFEASSMTESDVNNKEIALLAFNDGSAPYGFNTGGISYFWAFSGKLTDAEIAAFDAAIQAYLS